MGAPTRSAPRWRSNPGHLLPSASEGVGLAEVMFSLVDEQGCVTVKANFYSVPVAAGMRVDALIHQLHAEILASRSSDWPQ
jgi:hypothetical protein